MTFAAIPVLLFAAASLSADPAKHSVTFTAVATDIKAGTPVEFAFVGPDSDRAYEALFVTEARIKDIAAAFDKAGVPVGRAIDETACRFWPAGPRLSLEPSIWDFVEDKEKGEGGFLPPVYAGGTRGTDGCPNAETNMPGALFALYSCAQSPILLDDALDQSAVYGRFVSTERLESGRRVSFTVSWDGATAAKPYRLSIEPGMLKERLQEMRSASSGGGLDVTVHFSPEPALSEATAAASALAMLDSRAVRVNGFDEGQFFYRAFLPLEKWRDRKERLTQPLEVALSADGAAYTVVDEDWNVEGVDPKLAPRSVDFAEACGTKADTCFVYAAPDTKLGRFYELRKALPKSLRNWYFYASQP